MTLLAPAAVAVLLVVGGPACASGRPTRGFEQLQATSVFAGNARILGLLTSGQGNLLVLGNESDSLSVRYAVSTETRAGLFRNQVETIDKGDSLYVTIRPTASSSIDLQIESPEKLAVHLTDEGRDVIFRNIENRVAVFRHGAGSLNFDDIEGPLTIQDGTGPIRIHDVRGPIVIYDETGEIRVREVDNSLRIESRAGDVTIEEVGGDVSVIAGRGRLTVRDVKGNLSYKKSGTGGVSIEGIAGQVEEL